jgi:endogenous inhibitor of DNA gyrase (YacG/DUF329 family)
MFSPLHLASDFYNPTMPRQRQIKLRCPICKKPVKSADADFPFCSERCRLIDLGKWGKGAALKPCLPEPTKTRPLQIAEELVARAAVTLSGCDSAVPCLFPHAG